MVHKICAVLLKDRQDPDRILLEAEDVIENIAGWNNSWAIIGVVQSDGTLVPGNSPIWTIEELAKERHSREEWLQFVRYLALQDIVEVVDWDTIQKVEGAGITNRLIKALAAIIADPSQEPWRRYIAALRASEVAWRSWPYLTRLTSWRAQRVYKSESVDPREATIVFVDIDM